MAKTDWMSRYFVSHSCSPLGGQNALLHPTPFVGRHIDHIVEHDLFALDRTAASGRRGRHLPMITGRRTHTVQRLQHNATSRIARGVLLCHHRRPYCRSKRKCQRGQKEMHRLTRRWLGLTCGRIGRGNSAAGRSRQGVSGVPSRSIPRRHRNTATRRSGRGRVRRRQGRERRPCWRRVPGCVGWPCFSWILGGLCPCCLPGTNHSHYSQKTQDSPQPKAHGDFLSANTQTTPPCGTSEW